MALDDDELLILDDEEVVTSGVWKILIVDDDEDVHIATEHALAGETLLGRSLVFLHAHSAAEARERLQVNADVAVILLDVVMETQHAGLDLVAYIRRDLELSMPRIILRTGQPGYAPELTAVRDYDINDYKTKSELTRSKLYTTVLAALRSFDQLRRMDANRRGLEQIIEACGELLHESGLKAFSAGVIRQLAAFIGVESDGLLCTQVNLDRRGGKHAGDDDYIVLAAAGRYEPLIGLHLNQIDSPRVRDSLRLCLARQQHVFERESQTLYFSMQGSRGFAAYIDTSRPTSVIDSRLLEVFCANVSICADNINLINRLKDSAYFDHLVGLPNRTAFVQAVDHAYGEGANPWDYVVLVDIDQFAEINNAFGHEYGDHLLEALASRLKQRFEPDCFVARISGDTFGLLGAEAALKPEYLRAVFAEPFNINGAGHVVAISTGIVRLTDSGPDGQGVLKDASIARKLAREKSVNSDAYYAPHIGFQAKERTRLLQQLQGAFDLDRLFAVYQPQIDMVTRRVTGFEALMRWRNDAGEFVPPDHFIPLAEQSGLIVGMGDWILRDALHALRQLAAEGWRDLTMSVNVSAVQFRMPNFLDSLRQAIADTGVAPQLLELEITESVAMMGQTVVEETLASIRQMGISVAIDDFGTGFSSLSYLSNLPLDRIKIDRSFVHAMSGDGDSRRIADLVIQLGRNLNLRVIAEGVETEAQASRLLELGCHEVQGFLYGRPMDPDSLRDWLKNWKALYG
ncbi:EAL domain-containing protein [Thiobacillus sp.]|uniref:EAL domain-containing response regulator n=1 Tax=Thiobacillus sp. TaxID=924 RepID=UPI0025E9B1C8|nr:EAL domain-containing protein [Thiobacillus sp.]MBT9538398.1 EAL domain-containing protein [Thiobacillus sp.]